MFLYLGKLSKSKECATDDGQGDGKVQISNSIVSYIFIMSELILFTAEG